ncbi:MAG: oligopeptide ABC transporter ATP-binding protein OppD [Steroidobacteraceae bacterium]|nr:oligopeptide ABC transporter ATP-binding protein OppD [Steroidobacteraceae bacterium]
MLLDIRHLGVSYSTPSGEVEAVRDLTLGVSAGECVGVVGESGAGKSQAFLAALGLLPAHARVRGSVRFEGAELLGLPPRALNRIRGAAISMIFQDPLTSLTPHLRIGDQIAEPLVQHEGLSWSRARARALELLERVHITDPQRRMKQYPHELSGGMRQRVMIAMALACGPKLLIADEPTTALDVTIQAQILALLAELKREQGMSMVLITHDLGVVAGLADRVAVMQDGRIVELGPTSKVLKRPEHACTQALLSAVPRIERGKGSAPGDSGSSDDRVFAGNDAPPSRGDAGEVHLRTSSKNQRGGAALLSLKNLRVQFKVRGGWRRSAPVVHAVEDVSLTLNPGEVVGVVGESGSGKSTLARAALRLLPVKEGHVVWMGADLNAVAPSEMRALRRNMQLVFQDPLASLDPRMTVTQIVSEPLLVHRRDLDATAREHAVAEMLLRVGLGRNLMRRYPHELSGGQAQRVAIARAMVLKPRLLVCDEAVSALDVSVQAQIIALLQELTRESGTSVLFISHNLAVVREICDRVLVLYLGRAMEQGPAERVYEHPAHPYTRALLAAVPVPDPDSPLLEPTRLVKGELPSPISPPTGCVFHTRCPHAVELCVRSLPEAKPVGEGHEVACHRWPEVAAS